MLKTQNLTNTENLSLSDEIGVVAPKATPFASLLINNGKVKDGTGKIHTWTQKDLNFSDDDIREGQDVTDFKQSNRQKLNNVMQIFLRATAVSGTAQATTTADATDLFASELNDRLTELKVSMEKALINGVKDDASVTGVRKMAGLKAFVEEGNRVEVATDGVVVEKDLRKLAQAMFEAGNENSDIYLLVSANVKEQIDDIYKDSYSYQHKENNFGLIVSSINTNYGVLNVVVDRYMADDSIIAFDLNLVNLVYLRQPHFEELSKTGDSVKGQVVAEATLEVLSKKAIAELVIDLA